MRRVVLDAGVIPGWFDPDSPHRALRSEYETGMLTILAPRHLIGDVLAVIADRVPAERLPGIGAELGRLGFQMQDPPLTTLAAWIARGLPADRAAYAALAADLELPLVTDDDELRRLTATVPRG
jgi:predicted nucleic acid-binding protein